MPRARGTSILWLLLWANTTPLTFSSRAYPLGCSTQDSSYYDYDNYPFPPPGVPVKSTEDYSIIQRLGTGKFSDVYSALPIDKDNPHTSTADEVDPQALVVIKCLKPVSDRKVRRELLVLSHASKLPNLARLEALVLHPDFYASRQDPQKPPRMPSFVLQHAGPNNQFLCHPTNNLKQDPDYLTHYEIKYFLNHLLIALDKLHSLGIMHRDVKPRNILITRETQQSSTSSAQLMLIDLGLADFYLPNTPYNVRVASRHYKSPELLIGYHYYGYSVDLWPVGCILAGLLFRREPFFRGRDNDDQLAKIVAVLGTADLLSYMHRIQVPLETTRLSPERIQEWPLQRLPWMSFLRWGCPDPCPKALDLLDKLLIYDHDARLTAEEAMAHPFFDEVRQRVMSEVAAWEREQGK